ncbi:MAG: tRNA-(ms[2]io[6]A)-hydroxylase [Gammaproteobacteria bacterium]|nr:tRNA-(ms[2]io[6]A)-hydroxylase [Gammaproteobacteria bacterium]
MAELVPDEIRDFLAVGTPAAWVDAAAADLPTLVNDHANCEKKAAATAVSLMFRYADDGLLCDRMSRLAREELRHYEQVSAIMRRLGIPYQNVSAGRYAAGLRDLVRSHEPGRLTDTLIVGALIEARSCERFALLIPLLDGELGKFYRGLLASEARHFRHYLELAARDRAGNFETRLEKIREREGELASSPDSALRFHSGPPAAASVRPQCAADSQA